MPIEKKLDHRPSNLRRLSYAYGSAHHVHLYGPAGPVMQYGGRSYDVWCLNDYLGLVNPTSARDAMEQRAPTAERTGGRWLGYRKPGRSHHARTLAGRRDRRHQAGGWWKCCGRNSDLNRY